MKYRVYSDFGYEQFNTIEEAKSYGISKCFDFRVENKEGDIIGYWNYFAGWNQYVQMSKND